MKKVIIIGTGGDVERIISLIEKHENDFILVQVDENTELNELQRGVTFNENNIPFKNFYEGLQEVETYIKPSDEKWYRKFEKGYKKGRRY